MTRFSKRFFQLPTLVVARRLLGQRFVYDSIDGRIAGRIVEVEAYLSENDPACHAARGVTRRNQTMFGPPGRLYVYAIHSRYCMNVVTEPSGFGAAVLIRAIEPEDGMEIMQRNRPVDSVRELTNGPGKLCQAMGINTTLDGHCLWESDTMWIERVDSRVDFTVQTSTRIGLSQAKELELRFFIDGHQYVSGRASDHSIARNWCWNESNKCRS
ncbi:MAG: DNA-3-methyladenine glycosylase [Pirellula sp.]